MTDIVDAEAVEMPPERAMVTVDGGMAATGSLALAALTDDEFERRIAALEQGQARLARMQKALMVKDVDYGTIPGTPKPTLLKPGAEKLCYAYGLAGDFAPKRIVGDGLTAPNLAYQTRCELHLGSLDGPVIAVGYGSANSWERKHRYRNAERACPTCGNATGAILKSKTKPEWFCWAKKGGCGATFALGDRTITDQEIGQVANPDPWDLDTTLLKMAEKRAHVDATLRATAASGLFTQDVEDLPSAERIDIDRETGEIRHPVAQAPAEPKVPWSEGPVTLSGAAFLTAKMDGELRETPEGWRLGFALALDGTHKIPQVVAENQLALGISDALGGDARKLHGLAVTVTGEMWRVPWDKDGHPKPAFARLALTALETPEWSLPNVAETTPEPDAFPMFT